MSLRKCETSVNFGRNRKRFPSGEIAGRLMLVALLFLSVPRAANGCGPFFPNALLSSGDDALFTAPVADFRRELELLQLAPSRFDHVAATNGYAAQTCDAELADLATALQRAQVPGVTAAPIIAAHRKNRDKLLRYVDEHDAWQSLSWMDDEPAAERPRGPAPEFPTFEGIVGLPAEFADYFAGVVALRSPKPDRATALAAWERLLERPAAERKYKSTWAAFMLGKLWEKEDDAKAVKYFQLTRALAKKQFGDSVGLAVAAIGLEARVELRLQHFRRALELYLEQYAAGDESAVQSLRSAAASAVETGGDQLATLAAAPQLRAVITAYLISDRTSVDYPTGEAPVVRPVEAWLRAVEAAGVRDVAAAERLALAAYQDGEFELAERWIKRASASPTAQWLEAKLLLRAGKIPAAARLLAQVTRALPIVPPQELTNSMEFADALRVPNDSFQLRSLREQILGELGVLALSRADFSLALDALLRADFWEDAAYVAERVLTTEELKAYVDRDWPAGQPATETNAVAVVETDHDGAEVAATIVARPAQIRHLLARRLVRENRGREAQPYFPPQWQARCGELMDALDVGWNESAAAEQRAEALFAAAKLVRADGMELLGTELAPDWFIHGGAYDWGLTWESRGDNSGGNTINRMTEAEFQRVARHKPDPEQRFHYRYHAAALGWEAARLMPDNSAATARVLCMAGSWLKYRDPQAADLFYKALVKRCRQTVIGAQAEAMRWFPVLDEAGNPKPYRPQPKLEEIDPPLPEADFEPADLAVPGPVPQAESVYTIQMGDSLSAIAEAATALGRSITVHDLARANPGLDPGNLRVGQKIFIPAPAAESAPAADRAPNNLGIAPAAPLPLPSAP